MVEIVETPEAKLKRHEDALAACMVEITRLREENARLRSSENNAHSVLREVYNDPTASPAVRVKAAGLALPHETPRLAPVEPPLELTAEPYEPLADVVARQRARADRIRALPLSVREAMVRGVAPNADGNGSDDDTAAS
jgi:hypothetical protein